MSFIIHDNMNHINIVRDMFPLNILGKILPNIFLYSPAHFLWRSFITSLKYNQSLDKCFLSAMPFGSIYPLTKFVFFIFMHKWSFKFKICKFIADNIRYVKKYISWILITILIR
jgi:hypothetical protein